MKIIIRLFIVLLLVSQIAACKAVPPWQDWMLQGPPPGQEYPPDYVEGWQDGCETGISATANQWYKFSYKFRQDPYKAQQRVYYRGWKDSFDYCQRYMYQWGKRQLL